MPLNRACLVVGLSICGLFTSLLTGCGSDPATATSGSGGNGGHPGTTTGGSAAGGAGATSTGSLGTTTSSGTGTGGSTGSGPSLGGCTLFPADNPWNTDISDVKAFPV